MPPGWREALVLAYRPTACEATSRNRKVAIILLRTRKLRYSRGITRPRSSRLCPISPFRVTQVFVKASGLRKAYPRPSATDLISPASRRPRRFLRAPSSSRWFRIVSLVPVDSAIHPDDRTGANATERELFRSAGISSQFR